MATPEMLVQNFSKIGYKGSPGSIRINTFNPDGTPLNVSSGYGVESIQSFPQSQSNALKGATDVHTLFTPAFDATGVTLAYTGGNADSLNDDSYSLINSMYVYLSNDSNATRSLAAIGTWNVDANSLSLT